MTTKVTQKGHYQEIDETNDGLLDKLSPEVRAAQKKLSALCGRFHAELTAICDPVGIVFDLKCMFGVPGSALQGQDEPQAPRLLH